jgi:hypothetical protein
MDYNITTYLREIGHEDETVTGSGLCGVESSGSAAKVFVNTA